MLISIFASIFGVCGWLPILIASSVFFASYYINSLLSVSTAIIIIASTLLPLIAGALIWRGKSGQDEIDDDNKAYRNLASELTEVANKSEIVINAIGDGVIAIDGQGIIQLINPAAQLIMGWGKQDALALSYKSVLKLVDRKDDPLESNNDPIQQVLNGNQQIRTNDLTLITKSDKKILISLVVSPVGDPGAGVIAVFHDITKEKAEEREQAEFISTASHEMRTPVAAIEGYLGLAINPQTAQIDDRARDFIAKAHASAEHLGRLFQDLLDVSKSEDGRLSNNPKVINAVTFIHDVVQGLQSKADDKGLRLTYVPKPDDNKDRIIAPEYMVNLDNDHLREVINNLVENAIKYTPEGEVLVDVTGDDEHVTISIKDSGVGIPAEDMPHLFQKFYRVDSKETHEIGGTGLGLYLSRRLVEIMGGRIWAESVYTKGSTFYIELPRISNQEANRLSEQEEIAAQQNANKSKIEQQPNTQPNTAPEETPQLNTVPRGDALTPEQIAAYVANQHALAQQESNPQIAQNPNEKP